MNLKFSIFLLLFLSLFQITKAQVPTDLNHPGAKNYEFEFVEQNFRCSRRSVLVYLPEPLLFNTPIVVFGHGQSLDESHYKDTYIHLAKKGVAVIHPNYSTGFFDTNWIRMARDYINQVKCITDQIPELNPNSIVYSGHSKGAYVAGIAGALAFQENLIPKPSSLVLLNSAGLDPRILSHLPPEIEMTVVFSDKDRIVNRSISEDLYNLSPSLKKQFIILRSYPSSSGRALNADHFWPLTKSTWLGGTTENALHYNGSWKWLVAAAIDANQGANGTNPYLYGPLAIDKGVDGLQDEVFRNF